MQNRDLTAQARRLATLLNEEFGVNAGHARTMQLLARSLGYPSHQAMRADTHGDTPDTQLPPIWTQPMTQEDLQGRLNAQGQVTGTVVCTQADLIGRDLREVHATLSEKLTGTALLEGVTFDVIGVQDAQLLVQVTGNARVAVQTGGLIPVVDCEAHDDLGRHQVHFDGARYFLTMSDDELVTFLRQLPRYCDDTDGIAEVTATWDANVAAFFAAAAYTGFECTYDDEQVVLLALVTRPHLRERLVGHVEWPHAERRARWKLPHETDLHLPALRRAAHTTGLTDHAIRAAARDEDLTLDDTLTGDALLSELLDHLGLDSARALLEYTARHPKETP